MPNVASDPAISQPALPTRYCHFALPGIALPHAPAPKTYMLRKSATSSHHRAISWFRWRGAERFIHAHNAPPQRAEMGDESAKSKGKCV